MKKINEEILDTVDSMLYSGAELTFNLESLEFFKKTLKRWMKKVDENIKHLKKEIK